MPTSIQPPAQSIDSSPAAKPARVATTKNTVAIRAFEKALRSAKPRHSAKTDEPGASRPAKPGKSPRSAKPADSSARATQKRVDPKPHSPSPATKSDDESTSSFVPQEPAASEAPRDADAGIAIETGEGDAIGLDVETVSSSLPDVAAEDDGSAEAEAAEAQAQTVMPDPAQAIVATTMPAPVSEPVASDVDEQPVATLQGTERSVRPLKSAEPAAAGAAEAAANESDHDTPEFASPNKAGSQVEAMSEQPEDPPQIHTQPAAARAEPCHIDQQAPPDVSAAPPQAHSHRATPPAPPTTAAVAPEVRFTEDNHPAIVSSIRSNLLPNGGSMRLRLDPPELGALDVRLEMRDGVMSATFQTSNDDATRLLSHSLNQLKHTLESHGVSVAKLHVEQAPRDQASDQPSDDSQQQPHQDQAFQHEQQRREMLQRMWRRLRDGSDPVDLMA